MALVLAEAYKWLKDQPDRSIDLILSSPPYAEKADRYPDLKEELRPPKDWREWISWNYNLIEEAVRVAKIVFWVVDSPRVLGEYRPAVEGLLFHLATNPKFELKTPHIWHKNGAPGGMNWPGHDWEYVIAVHTKGEEFYYDPKAIGAPAKFDSGPGRQRGGNGTRRVAKKGVKKGVLARPRDVLSDFFRVTVGGGHLGRSVASGVCDMEDDKFASQGQAPFPWWLATRFVTGFSPPGGVVGDCFTGTGTVRIAAYDAGRTFRGCELSPSQFAIAQARAKRLNYPIVF